MDSSELAREVTPVVRAAVAAYGTAALTRDADEQGEPTAELGSDILQSVYWRAKNVPMLEGSVNDLAARPHNEDAVGALRLQITKALEADDTLLEIVERSLNGGSGDAALSASAATEAVAGDVSEEDPDPYEFADVQDVDGAAVESTTATDEPAEIG